MEYAIFVENVSENDTWNMKENLFLQRSNAKSAHLQGSLCQVAM